MHTISIITFLPINMRLDLGKELKEHPCMPGVLKSPEPAAPPLCPSKLLRVGRPPPAELELVVVVPAAVEAAVVDPPPPPAAQGLGAGALFSVVGVGLVASVPPSAWNGLGPPMAFITGSCNCGYQEVE